MSKNWEAIAQQTNAANDRLVNKVEALEGNCRVLLAGLREQSFTIGELRVGLTDFADGMHQAALQAGVIAPLAAQFPQVAVVFDTNFGCILSV